MARHGRPEHMPWERDEQKREHTHTHKKKKRVKRRRARSRKEEEEKRKEKKRKEGRSEEKKNKKKKKEKREEKIGTVIEDEVGTSAATRQAGQRGDDPSHLGAACSAITACTAC